MGHAHCTSGAPTCSEIPYSLAWSRKAPSIHGAPRGGTVQVLTNRDVKPSGRVLRICPAFCLREARWWLQLEMRKTSNLHYTIALHTTSPVFSHHTTNKGVSPILELESQLSENTDTFRNNPKTTLILGVDFNAGGIDWETGLVPDDSPNRFLKEKLIEVISKAGLQQMQREPTGARAYWISSVVISPRLLRLVFPFLVFRTTVLF